MSSEILTEVETCMIRIALRHMADHTPDRPRDEGLGKRDYHRIATAVTFVGADQAAANARLYTDEALDEWIAEWNKSAIAEPVEREGTPPPVHEDELVPF